MDKIFSARLDDTAIDEMDRVSRRLGITKKEFLESAIRLRAHQLDQEASRDIFAETNGAWKRSETPEVTLRRARGAFQKDIARHHRSRRQPSG